MAMLHSCICDLFFMHLAFIYFLDNCGSFFFYISFELCNKYKAMGFSRKLCGLMWRVVCLTINKRIFSLLDFFLIANANDYIFDTLRFN